MMHGSTNIMAGQVYFTQKQILIRKATIFTRVSRWVLRRWWKTNKM